MDEIIKNETLPYDDVLEYARKKHVGAADMLAEILDKQIVYDHTNNRWLLWNGNHWEHDHTNSIMDLAVKTIVYQFHQALSTAFQHSKPGDIDNPDIEALTGAINAMYYRSTIDNVLKLAQGKKNLAITGTQLDSNPWWMGTQNGVIDLKSGGHRPGRPEDYLLNVAPVEWQGLDKPAPRWEQYLREIFANDNELVAFVQRLLGYALIGSVKEHILPVLIGDEGRNGKGVLLAVLKRVLGPYATAAPKDILMAGRASAGEIMYQVAALQFVRLVYISETNEGDVLNAGVVKLLTGGDERNARNPYGKPFTYIPRDTPLLITNIRPHINSEDAAMWERVHLIEFTQRFIDDPAEENEHKADKYLSDKLEAETSGILAWLVRGCLQWQEQGLNPPQSVKMATETYRQDEDTLGQFVEACCVVDESAMVGAKEFYTAYSDWSKENGIKPMSGTTFGRRMGKRFEKQREGGTGKTIYHGVGLTEDYTFEIDERTKEILERGFAK